LKPGVSGFALHDVAAAQIEDRKPVVVNLSNDISDDHWNNFTTTVLPIVVQC